MAVAALCRSRCAYTVGSPARRVAAAARLDMPFRLIAPIRRPDAQEHLSRIGGRTHLYQVRHDRFTHVGRQRQHLVPVPLATDSDLTAPPIDVVEAQRDGLADPKSQSGQHGQDRPITHAASPRSTAKYRANCVIGDAAAIPASG